MLFKRFLFLLSDEFEISEFIKFSKSLEIKYPNIEKDLVYIKDIMKYNIKPTSIQGIGFNSINTEKLIEEYLELEENKYQDYREKLEKNFRKVYSVEGEVVEKALEELKAYDLLVVCKSEREQISDDLKKLLKLNYKPIIILSKTEKDYSFDNILMLNDGEYRVNRSIYQYFNIFSERDIDVLRVNVKDQNRLTERFGTKCNIIDKEGDVASVVLEYVPNYDMVIMGELKHSLLFEKIMGQIGVKILEQTKTPIFMG